MKQKDAELIQRVLQGDQEAFGFLVKKYQKGVHALVWRKIGDFHIAEEITQDAFFRAYQKLGTLKNHNLFAGWLYVIASRLCADWFQKNSPPEQSLEVTAMSEVNQVSYSQYVSEKQAAETDETRREIVKKLLQKLPESERTVITLYYLGEMTIKTISEFLGVSPNTVKSRLSRARNRLRKEEHMIRQNLGSFQLPPYFTENIMRDISRITPAAPTTHKPVVPWALSAVSAIALFLLFGAGTQYLSRFQKPYDLNATSERTVELIEAVLVLDSPAKPAVRNQPGSSSTPGRNPGAGQQPDARLFAAALVDETEVPTPEPQWIQTKGPAGGLVNTLFTTTRGDIYAGSYTNLYKLSDDGPSWKLVIAGSLSSLNMKDFIIGSNTQQMVERDDTLYIAIDAEVLTSTDYGETWDSLGAHPKGQPVGLVITDAVPGAEADITLNLALIEGVFRSADAGKSWIPLNDENLAGRKIRAIAAVENILFAGTDNGLYRRDMDTWEKLTIRPTEMSEDKTAIHALAVDKHRLYVAAGDEVTNQNQIGMQLRASLTGSSQWSLYRSTDQGDSWYSIDPRKRQEHEEERQQREQFGVSVPFPGAEETEIHLPSIKLLATQGRVIVVDAFGELFYSMNTGETWTALDIKGGSGYNVPPPVLMMDENTFYKGGPSGVQTTIDGGKTWSEFNSGLVGTPVQTLIAVQGELYANSTNGFVTSTDAGESWTPLPRGIDHGVFIKVFDGVLYVKRVNQMNSPSPIAHLSTEDNSLTFISGMPAFENVMSQKMDEEMNRIMMQAFTDVAKQDLEEGVPPNPEDVDFDQLNEAMNKFMQEQASASMMTFIGNFAVSGDTYYVEYGKTLYRWRPGMTEWHNTGLVDTGEDAFASLLSGPFDYSADVSTSYDTINAMGFRIAVSDSTVYVGKREGRLFQSFDEGDTWNDVTVDLPFSFEKFEAIVFAEPTVYVATDKGVAYSSDGTHWHIATDAEGSALVVSRLAVEDTTVYGQTDQHVYLLKVGTHTWKQATPELPSAVISFAVDGNTLYVGTANRGVLRFELDQSL
ncbi:sigma-70 family RNA polymerase sigma factor [Candidatus Poribacteria bacterium]|nr:sigma-70 family RNA polymerase sigma factor [Candidatus Poribacteria bacterium]